MLRRGWTLMGGLRLSGRLWGNCLRGLGFCEGGVSPLKTLYRFRYVLYGIYRDCRIGDLYSDNLRKIT